MVEFVKTGGRKHGTQTAYSTTTKKDYSVRPRKAADSSEKSTIQKYLDQGIAIVKGIFD